MAATDSYMLKLERAVHHLENLAIEFRRWLTPERHTIVREPDPDGPYQMRVRVIFHESLPAAPFSLLIGDALYNLRSSLDSLAYALAGGGVGQNVSNESEFPIFGNQNRQGKPVNGAIVHNGAFNSKTSGISQAAKTIIKGLQPYNRGNGYGDDPLWQVHALCNADKHRHIHLVVCSGAGFHFRVEPAHNIDVQRIQRSIWAYEGILKESTVVLRYTAYPADPARDVNVNFNPTLGVGFADGIAGGKFVLYHLMDLHGYILRKVIAPLEPHIPGGTVHDTDAMAVAVSQRLGKLMN